MKLIKSSSDLLLPPFSDICLTPYHRLHVVLNCLFIPQVYTPYHKTSLVIVIAIIGLTVEHGVVRGFKTHRDANNSLDKGTQWSERIDCHPVTKETITKTIRKSKKKKVSLLVDYSSPGELG
jgi:hypothetical protein